MFSFFGVYLGSSCHFADHRKRPKLFTTGTYRFLLSPQENAISLLFQPNRPTAVCLCDHPPGTLERLTTQVMMYSHCYNLGWILVNYFASKEKKVFCRGLKTSVRKDYDCLLGFSACFFFFFPQLGFSLRLYIPAF